jgi:hypothetical protein
MSTPKPLDVALIDNVVKLDCESAISF